MVRLSRRRSLKVIEQDNAILKRIQAVKSDHSFWGYRRVWSYLTYRERCLINKKRVYRLMKEQDLLVKPNLRIKAKRSESRHKPRPTRRNEWWGIDMTKVMLDGFGWVYVVFVLDWYTKKIVGYYVGVQCKSEH